MNDNDRQQHEAPVRPPRFAPVFDLVDRVRGPLFLATHPILEVSEIAPLAAYLNAGVVVSSSPLLSPDILDPDLDEVVPVQLRTDGVWVWSEATTYYLQTYGVAPEPNLLVHLRTQGVYSWEPDEATLDRIQRFVYTTGQTEAAHAAGL